MNTTGYKMYKELVEQRSNPTRSARLVHYAAVALLKREIDYTRFLIDVDPFRDQTAAVSDSTGHVPDGLFSFQDISAWLGSDMHPARLYISHFDHTPRQLTFRLDPQGAPQFQIYDHRH